MHNIHKLKVYNMARENLRGIITECKTMTNFGDLRNQIQRSAISVVSNIAEGANSNSNANFARFLGYARASNKELHTQLEILSDLGQLKQQELIVQVDKVGAMLYRLWQRWRE